jgi:hypothetical protein
MNNPYEFDINPIIIKRKNIENDHTSNKKKLKHASSKKRTIAMTTVNYNTPFKHLKYSITII